MAFIVLTVEQVGPDILRVEYSDIPKASNDTSAIDALNPSNYLISGPGSNAIALIAPVSAQSNQIDIFLSNNLAAGSIWTVRVSNVQDVLGDVVVTNTFTVIGAVFNTNPITGGAQDQTAEQFLRRNLNPALKGSTWNALLAAIGSSEQKNWDNAKYAFDQLYASTASGEYLKERGSDYGVVLPYNVSFTEEDFRRYINLIINRQLTIPALNEMLSLFYGIDGTHATSISENAEPYNITDGSLLYLKVDGQFDATILFTNSYFTDNTKATALEISAAIDEQLQVLNIQAYAIPFLNNNGETYVKLISKTAGLGSKLQVLGGQAQNILSFDLPIPAFIGGSPLPTWTITKLPQEKLRFTSTTTPTNLDISVEQSGFYVNIYGSEFNSKNRGTFILTAVGKTFGPLTQYFEIVNPEGVAEAVVQLSETSMQFFNPIERTLYSVSPDLASYVVQTGDQSFDVILPAVPASVERTLLTGSYLQDNDILDIDDGYRSYFSTNIGLGLNTSVGTYTGQGILENFIPVLTRPTVTAAPFSNSTDWSPSSIWSLSGSDVLPVSSAQTYKMKTVRFSNGTVLFAGGQNAAGVAKKASVFFNATNEFSDPQIGRRFRCGFNASFVFTNATGIRNHAMTTIFNGEQALLTGGIDGVGAVSALSFIYNQASGWTSLFDAINSGFPRSDHAQVTLSDGNVLLVGGLDVASAVTTNCQIYLSFGNAFISAGSLNLTRGVGVKAVLLNNGKVLALGGRADTTCELYDPLLDSWSFTGNRRYLDGTHKSLLFKLRDGRILMVGGDLTSPSNGETFNGHTEIYDPSQGFWIEGPRLITDSGFEIIDLVGASLDNPGNPNPSETSITETDYQSIVVFARDPAVGVDVKTQFLEIKPVFNYLQYPDLKWREGPAIPSAIAIKDGSFIWADGSLMIYAYGLNPGLTTLRTQGIAYIKNCDKWGYVGPSASLQEISLTPTDLTIISNEILDYSEFLQIQNTVTPMAAGISDGIPGPYIWDPMNGVDIGGAGTTLTGNYYKGNSYFNITVADTTGFPAEGYIVINFALDSGFDNGTDPIYQKNAIYPIKYTAVVSSTILLLDDGFVFSHNALSGSTVSYLNQKGPFSPVDGLVLGSDFMTDTPAARIAAERALDQIEPAGPEVFNRLIYPSDRGLGNEGYPTVSNGDPLQKLSDLVEIYSGSQDSVDAK
jgi:hypothetical protein